MTNVFPKVHRDLALVRVKLVSTVFIMRATIKSFRSFIIIHKVKLSPGLSYSRVILEEAGNYSESSVSSLLSHSCLYSCLSAAQQP